MFVNFLCAMEWERRENRTGYRLPFRESVGPFHHSTSRLQVVGGGNDLEKLRVSVIILYESRIT
jgi:hypothetical protein